MSSSIDDLYPEVDIKEAICKQVAMMKIAGVSKTAASKKLGVSPRKFEVIWDSHEVSFYTNKLVEDSVRDFRAVLIKEVAGLVPLLVDTIKFHLEQKNLQAVPHTLKILGFDKEQVESNQQITVVMPDFNKPTTINADFENTKSETTDTSTAKERNSNNDSPIEVDISI